MRSDRFSSRRGANGARAHRGPIALALLAALTVLVACTGGHSSRPTTAHSSTPSPAPSPTSSATSPHSSDPGHDVALGASVQAADGQSPAAAIAGLESRLGRTLAYDRDYLDWDDPIPNSLMTADRQLGRTTVLSIRPTLRSDNRPISWASIAAGEQDAQIRRQAAQVKSFGVTVLIAFHHEADVAQGFGTASQFAAAYRHFVTVFRASGADNARFVLILTPTAYANDPWAWYPGDDYVDWIATDAYNFGGCRPDVSGWRSLAAAAGTFYRWASAQGKPLLLAEFGSAEDRSDPNRQAEWLQQAAGTLADWPSIKAVIYFDQIGTCDWRLQNSAATMSAFRNFARSSGANAGTTARLLPQTKTGSAPRVVSFDATASTGAGHATGAGVSTWSFDAGDDTRVIRGSGQPGLIRHVYLRAGTYHPQLTVSDGSGGSAQAESTLVLT